MDSNIIAQKRSGSSKTEGSPSPTVNSDEEGGQVGSAGYSVAASISTGDDYSKKELAETTDLLNIPPYRSGSSQTEDSPLQTEISYGGGGQVGSAGCSVAASISTGEDSSKKQLAETTDSPLQTEISYGGGSAGSSDASIAAGGSSTAAISTGEESSRTQLTQVVTTPDLLGIPLTEDSTVKIENIGDESPGVRFPGRTDAAVAAGPNTVWISTKEHSLIREEKAGMLKFFCFSSGDNASDLMDWLTELKAIFTKQLPKLPTEYIEGVVMNRDHKTTMAVRLNQVIGGITYRPYMSQKFGEIALCAIAEEKRYRGYGTRLMTNFKQQARSDGLTHLLTYADDTAIDYFIKQGFTKEIHMEKDRWQGCIQQYDGATLMECELSSKHMLQKEVSVPQELVKAEDAHGSDEVGILPDHSIDTQYKGLIITSDAATNQKHLTDFLSSLLKSMNNHADAGAFNNQVDVLHVINDPIDLKTINERVESGQYYFTVEMFVADVKRMIANTRTLHGPQSMHYRCANRFETYFDIIVNCQHILWTL